MISGTEQGKIDRCLRLGMVGGGPGGFIGAVHRAAARLDGRFEMVAAALSSNPDKSLKAGRDLHIPRTYRNLAEMAEKERNRDDCIDAVAIVTPNDSHYPIAKMFLCAGINVICEKPLVTSIEDAYDLSRIVKESNLLFGLTYTYTGYPLIRHAREMILSGELGEIRMVHVEYLQDWLTVPLEATGQKQAQWRTDPTRSGPGGCIGDIGTHAFHLIGFTTGLECSELAAEVTTFVSGRKLDDNVQVLLRFSTGARGLLWASQVAPGNENALRLRIYGEKGGLSWTQEDPNHLIFTHFGKSARIITRGSACVGPAAKHATRIPAGHPEGYLEAFGQLYADMAEKITARLEERAPDPRSLLVPEIEAGVMGVRFINAALDSAQQGSTWRTLKDD